MSKAELEMVRDIIPDALEGVQTAYILACIRESRTTQRITELRAGGELVLVEESKEKGYNVNGAV
jgi:hypothetical protein